MARPCDGGTFIDKTEAASQADCQDCPAGFSCPSGSERPSVCGKGTYSPTSRQDTCTECPQGTFASNIGFTACTVVSKGHYAQQRAVVELKCSPSYYQDEEGQGDCQGHPWCTPTPCTFPSVH